MCTGHEALANFVRHQRVGGVEQMPGAYRAEELLAHGDEAAVCRRGEPSVSPDQPLAVHEVDDVREVHHLTTAALADDVQ